MSGKKLEKLAKEGPKGPVRAADEFVFLLTRHGRVVRIVILFSIRARFPLIGQISLEIKSASWHRNTSLEKPVGNRRSVSSAWPDILRENLGNDPLFFNSGETLV